MTLDANVQEVVACIERGEVPADDAFDRYLPEPLKEVAGHFWTPFDVAMRVAAWLEEVGAATVLDIGSGVGKFCVAGALASRCRFVGLEQRPPLVETARDLAQRFGVADRVSFVLGALDPRALPPADAYYLFNPFGENVAPSNEHLDQTVELSDARFASDVAAMESVLRAAPAGTHVVVYNGFGGRMPPRYESLRVDYERPHVLRLWVHM